ncbi:unnamed protein product [Orchesella dallaii]|uniref:LITAF domain-containing protein n=1 Tax=Orchesella dallaii TaxID=48710 RepID=A0ABP1RYK3_9HEXA
MSAPPPYNPNSSTQPPSYPSPGFQEPYPQAAPCIIVHDVSTPQQQPQLQQMIIVGPALGSHNARITCPHCKTEIQTKTDKKPGVVAWVSSGVLCFFGCWLGCCLIPFCIDSCMDVDHKCPNCDAHLGTHKPM